MSAPEPSDPKPDLYLRLLREGITALIALVVVAATMVLVFQTLQLASGDDAFQRGKDLLLFINPLLGVVLGYYFNKVTSEARAEHAEATARQAATTVQAATTSPELAQRGAQLAETKAAEAETRAEEVSRTVADLADASERFLAAPPPGAPGVLGPGGTGPAHDDAREALERALARARRQIV